jgi:hypothetical protein
LEFCLKRFGFGILFVNLILFRDFGIDVEDFAELLISSGLVLNPKIKWLAFHGGYDFAYLIRCMTGENLPADENGKNERKKKELD